MDSDVSMSIGQQLTCPHGRLSQGIIGSTNPTCERYSLIKRTTTTPAAVTRPAPTAQEQLAIGIRVHLGVVLSKFSRRHPSRFEIC
jgi:hypothetical protein